MATFLAGHNDEVSIIKIAGRATWQDSVVLKKYQDTHTDLIISANRVVFDLTECQFLDSTILGIIGYLSAKFMNKTQKKPIVLYADDKIKKILDIVNSHHFLEAVNVKLDPSTAEKVEIKELEKVKSDDEDKLRENILLAHETLIELSPENVEKFSTLIEDIKKSKNNFPNSV
jgi:anti-anti-sigma regulatory factor